MNKRKQKHLFGVNELIAFNYTFWTVDEGHFIYSRNKAQVPFLISVYCWTGARIGSFFPDKHGKMDAGLRYRVYVFVDTIRLLLITYRMWTLFLCASLAGGGKLYTILASVG